MTLYQHIMQAPAMGLAQLLRSQARRILCRKFFPAALKLTCKSSGRNWAFWVRIAEALVFDAWKWKMACGCWKAWSHVSFERLSPFNLKSIWHQLQLYITTRWVALLGWLEENVLRKGPSVEFWLMPWWVLRPSFVLKNNYVLYLTSRHRAWARLCKALRYVI